MLMSNGLPGRHRPLLMFVGAVVVAVLALASTAVVVSARTSPLWVAGTAAGPGGGAAGGAGPGGDPSGAGQPGAGQPGAGQPGAGQAGAGQPGTGAPPQPTGQAGGWDVVFHDDFEGTSLDRARWDDVSTALADQGHGNAGNQQLEWNSAKNCAVSDGALTMTARRESTRSPSGNQYDWTSCLITSTPSFTFQYGFIEERAILPAPKGFWPAFWTWQAAQEREHIETDVFEFYSDNHRMLYTTQYSGGGGRCEWKPPFDPTADWHTYAANIAPDGTTWYVDGEEICRTAATSAGPTNLMSNLAVYSKIPPDRATNEATKRVDYIRAWRPAGAG